jgi:hypothetical protein
MSILDDEKLSEMLAIKPFQDWLNPTEYGRSSIVTPLETFQQAEQVEGGIVVRDMQVQRRLTLDKGLRADGFEQGEIRVSGLIPSSVWEKSAETWAVMKENQKEYNRLMEGTVSDDIQGILHEQSEMRRKGGGKAVWELDGTFTQDELIRLGLAQERTEVKPTSEEFIPDPSKPPVPGQPRGSYDNQEAVQEVADKLKHEAVNVYGEQGAFAPYLSPTWWMFLEDLESQMSEFDEIREAEDSLQKTLYERLMVEPGAGIDEETQRLMGARYEFPIFGFNMIYGDAKLPQVESPLAWVDFLAGFAYGDCEMLTLVGEVTTEKEEWPTTPDEDGMPVPPIPDELFDEETYTEKKTAHNLNWLESDRVDVFADGVGGEPEPQTPNWWLRVNLKGDEKYPYPGEFFGLGVRIFPNLTWGSQKNSPFLFGGHWIDTPFITSGEATIVEKTDKGYYLCQMDWRKDKQLKVYPSDFAEYKVGDRCTVMKDVNTTKTSQLWKDEDCFKFDEEIWRIVPITYYGRGLGA